MWEAKTKGVIKFDDVTRIQQHFGNRIYDVQLENKVIRDQEVVTW